MFHYVHEQATDLLSADWSWAGGLSALFSENSCLKLHRWDQSEPEQ